MIASHQPTSATSLPGPTTGLLPRPSGPADTRAAGPVPAEGRPHGVAPAAAATASAPDAAPDPAAVPEIAAPDGARSGAPAPTAGTGAVTPPAPATPQFAHGRLPATSRARADRRLFERFAATRDPADREAIIERFLPLARQLAASYQRPTEPFDDIYQVACYGLVKAVDRFEPARGRAFTSYAVPTIVGEIKRHFRDRTWAVRVPRDLQELSLRVDRTVGDLTRRLGRQPSVAEIAQAVAVEPEDVLEAMEAGYAYRANSLDAPRPGGNEEDGATLGDTLGEADDGFARAEHRALIAELLRSLPVRERLVIEMRFDGECTQAEIGDHIGVSQMQVSRILRSTLARLHRTVTDAERLVTDAGPAPDRSRTDAPALRRGEQ